MTKTSKKLSANERLIVSFYILYLKTISFLNNKLGIYAYGLGFIASKIKFDFHFVFRNSQFLFSSAAARSYCLLPASIPNEPETHLFIDKIIGNKNNVMFIDVGASIGEFVIPCANDHRISKVIAFEPHPVTSLALQNSVALSLNNKVEIIQKGVSSFSGYANFDFSEVAPTSAGIHYSAESKDHDKIEVTTLDDVITSDKNQNIILLIDIEGGELEALKGGSCLIKNTNPVIIFEYNETTRKFFSLAEAIDFLGQEYQTYKLCSIDGRLDKNLCSTWNIVAIPTRGPWKKLLEQDDLFVGKKV